MNMNFKDGLFMFIVFIALTIFSCIKSHSQEVLGDFVEDQRYSRAIQLYQTHHYSIDLKKGEFASLTLDQMGIDLVIAIVDPAGNEIETFDTPNGKNGVEMILIDCKMNGRHKIQIRPLGEKKKPNSGRYFLIKNGVTTSINQHIDTVLSNLCKRKHIPGFAVSILSTNEVLFQKGYGYADLGYRIPYTTETVQGLASISKTLIGISLMQLAESGKLKLDQPINDILPFKVFNPHYPDIPITIRHLAQHSSSINYTKHYTKTNLITDDIQLDKKAFHKQDYKDCKIAQSNEKMSMPKYLQKVFSETGKWYSKDNFIKSKPGSTYQYSNESAALAAYVVELVSGLPFDEYTIQNILNPLGLTYTGWELENNNDKACSVKYGINKNPCPPCSGIIYPDGGLFSNVKELGIYLMEMMKGIKGKGMLLTQQSYQTITDKQAWPSGKHTGIFCEFTNDGRWGHSGGDIGILTAMYANPETETGSILLSNRSFDGGLATEEFKSIWKVINRYAPALKRGY